MAEQLSQSGVPVFLADIKSDLSGMASAGRSDDRVTSRAGAVGQEWVGTAYPTESCLLVASATASRSARRSPRSVPLCCHGCWGSTRRRSRASGWSSTTPTGTAWLSSATAGVILRNLIAYSDQGADVFFGEAEFDTADLLRVAPDGRGMVTCLELPSVQDRPKLFSTFLMWMLADLFHHLPEVGDLDKPRLVCLFDEAQPALRRREQGVSRRDRADRAARSGPCCARPGR